MLFVPSRRLASVVRVSLQPLRFEVRSQRRKRASYMDPKIDTLDARQTSIRLTVWRSLLSVNHGYPQPVGTCLRCQRPCYPPHFVAYPNGPMHPECVNGVANAPRKSRSSAESMAAMAVGAVFLLGFWAFYFMNSRESSKTNDVGVKTEVRAKAPKKDRSLQALCEKLRTTLKNGYCKETDSGGAGLVIEPSTVLSPQCRTEEEYRRIEPKKPERSLVFVGSESSWCFVIIWNMTGQPVSESLIKETQRAVPLL